MEKIVITIDGPSGSGKGTTARGVARKLQLSHIDSGSIYRAIAYFLYSQDVLPNDDNTILEHLKNFRVSYNNEGHLLINGVLAEEDIRTRENSARTFNFSRNAIIREHATQLQRQLLREQGGVLDGRDAGSVVAPFADLKIYLDCDIDERVRRRAKQHGVSELDEINRIKKEIEERDEADMNKGDASLRILPDSLVVDTTGLTVDEQIERVYQMALVEMKQQSLMGDIKKELASPLFKLAILGVVLFIFLCTWYLFTQTERIDEQIRVLEETSN